MIAGIPTGRLLLYGGAVAVLVAVNVVRLGGTTDTATGPEQRQALIPVTERPALLVARDIEGPAVPPVRDLFRRGAPRPLVAEAPAVEAPPPDPLQVARNSAIEKLRDMRLIGVMESGGNTLAVLEHDGIATSVGEGMEVIPGFMVRTISIDEIEIEHSQMGLTGTLSIDNLSAAKIEVAAE